MDTIRGDALTANSYAAHIDTLFKYLEGAPGEMLEIVFVDGIEKIFVKNGDLLRVTSESGLVKDYFIKVTGQYINYDAFVTSDIYFVNQDWYTITFDFLDYDSVLVSDLLANLIPSPGASVKVLDANGREKTGLVISGDIVKVTSADGFTIHTYNIEIQLPIVNPQFTITSVRIYPNPSSDNFHISGIPAHSRIVCINAMGQTIFETLANQDPMQVTLEKQPAGMYFILISNNTGSVFYKVIVK
jgi:hypothetical protein